MFQAIYKQSLVAREGVINVLRALQSMRESMLAAVLLSVNKKLGEFASGQTRPALRRFV
jgi:hypothetical protein